MTILQVSDKLSVDEFCDKFSEAFPYLLIEITNKKRYHNLKLGEILPHNNFKEFTVSEEMKVTDFLELIKKNTGLDLHIYRKMGSSNVETTYTQDWTLKYQNFKGQQIF